MFWAINLRSPLPPLRVLQPDLIVIGFHDQDEGRLAAAQIRALCQGPGLLVGRRLPHAS